MKIIKSSKINANNSYTEDEVYLKLDELQSHLEKLICGECKDLAKQFDATLFDDSVEIEYSEVELDGDKWKSNIYIGMDFYDRDEIGDIDEAIDNILAILSKSYVIDVIPIADFDVDISEKGVYYRNDVYGCRINFMVEIPA